MNQYKEVEEVSSNRASIHGHGTIRRRLGGSEHRHGYALIVCGKRKREREREREKERERGGGEKEREKKRKRERENERERERVRENE